MIVIILLVTYGFGYLLNQDPSERGHSLVVTVIIPPITGRYIYLGLRVPSNSKNELVNEA